MCQRETGQRQKKATLKIQFVMIDNSGIRVVGQLQFEIHFLR